MTKVKYSTSAWARYMSGLSFDRPTIIRAHRTEPDSAWLVLGPGWPWLGADAKSFKQALKMVRVGPKKWKKKHGWYQAS